MKRKLTIGLLAVLLLISGGCTTLKDIIKEPEVSIKQVVPTAVSFSEISLEMELLVNNPNPVGIELAGYDYDLTIDGSTFVKGIMDEAVSLEANGSSVFKVPLTIAYAELYESLKALADGTESAYGIVTGFSFDIPILGEQRLEAGHEGTIPHVKRPRFSFDSLDITRLSLTGADVEVGLSVENPNGFDFGLNNLQARFAVNDIKWVDLASLEPVSIVSGATEELDFRFSLDFINMGKLAYKLIQEKDRVSYNLDGGILLASSLPLLEETELPLALSGEVDMTKPPQAEILSDHSVDIPLPEDSDSLLDEIGDLFDLF